MLEGLGHDVLLGHPAALDDPSFTPRFMAMWATNMALGIKTMESWIGREMTAADIEPVNWAQAQWAIVPRHIECWDHRIQHDMEAG